MMSPQTHAFSASFSVVVEVQWELHELLTAALFSRIHLNAISCGVVNLQGYLSDDYNV